MKRFLPALVFVAFTAALFVVAIQPLGAAKVMQYTKAAAVSSGDVLFMFKKTSAAVFETQVADPTTVRLGMGVQAGSTAMATNLIVTNTFPTTFTASPVIVLTADLTNAFPVVSLLASNKFAITTLVTNTTVKWVAVGAP